MALCGSTYTTAVADATTCSAASGFSFSAISAAPTPPQISRICSNPSCSKLLKAIRAAVPSECQVGSGGSKFDLYKQILDPINAVCTKNSVPAASTTAGSFKTDSSASSGGSKAETVDTVAPPSPEPTTKATANDTTATPATTATKSDGACVRVAALAVAVTAALAFV